MSQETQQMLPFERTTAVSEAATEEMLALRSTEFLLNDAKEHRYSRVVSPDSEEYKKILAAAQYCVKLNTAAGYNRKVSVYHIQKLVYGKTSPLRMERVRSVLDREKIPYKVKGGSKQPQEVMPTVSAAEMRRIRESASSAALQAAREDPESVARDCGLIWVTRVDFPDDITLINPDQVVSVCVPSDGNSASSNLVHVRITSGQVLVILETLPQYLYMTKLAIGLTV